MTVGSGDSSQPLQPLPAGRLPEDPRPIFFDVSIRKLVVLSVCSLGIYEGYWFYRNWQIIRARERSDISPLARAAFSYFFCYALFKQVRDHDPRSENARPLPAGALAAGWIVVTFLWQLPGRYSLVANLACLFIVPVQAAANRVNLNAGFPSDNTRFTALNWLTVVLGGAILVLYACGALTMPEPG